MQLIGQNRERRLARYEMVMELFGQGVSQREIARQCGLSRKTVRRFVRARGFPERKHRRRGSFLDQHRDYLEMRWKQGCHNSARLCQELRDQGIVVRLRTLRDWMRKKHGPRKRCDQPQPSVPALVRASPRQVAWWILKPSERTHLYLDQLIQESPGIARCADLAREFFRMIRDRDTTAWPDWRDATARSPFASFTKRLCRDEAAFLSALTLSWSNGPVEGQVHRLKLSKRSMYGRANSDLLRLRVVNAV